MQQRQMSWPRKGEESASLWQCSRKAGEVVLEAQGVWLLEELRMRSLWTAGRKKEEEHEWTSAAMVSMCPSLQRSEDTGLRRMYLGCNFGHRRGGFAVD